MQPGAFEKFVADLSSGYWWMSVCVVGLIINLVSAYLKSPLDRILDSRRAASTARRKKRDAAFFAEVEEVAANPALVSLKGFEEARWRSLIFLLGGGAFVLMAILEVNTERLTNAGALGRIARFALPAASVFWIALSFWALGHAMRASAVLAAARDLISSRIGPPNGTLSGESHSELSDSPDR